MPDNYKFGYIRLIRDQPDSIIWGAAFYINISQLESTIAGKCNHWIDWLDARASADAINKTN